MKSSESAGIQLDPSRLLGFDQTGGIERKSLCNPKIGCKEGSKNPKRGLPLWLDKSKLLGFDQTSGVERLSLCNPKIGCKDGCKSGNSLVEKEKRQVQLDTSSLPGFDQAGQINRKSIVTSKIGDKGGGGMTPKVRR